jgi:hypothetical protein
MFNTLLKSALVAITLGLVGPTLAYADCEADLLKLEDALAKPDLSADNKAALEAAGEKAATAMRKDDDDVCNKLVMDALALVGAAPAVASTPAVSAATGSLGDLSAFKTIATDTLKIIQGGDLAAAKTRIKDLEKAWDVARPKLHAMNVDSWNTVDKAIDISLKALRAGSPDAKVSGDALTAMITVMDELQAK